MKLVRIIGAAFLVLLGAMMLVGWSVAGKAVGAIESGEAATNITQKLLDDPNFADAAAQRVTDRLLERTEGSFVGRIVELFEPEIQSLVVDVLTSDRLNAAVTQSVSKVEQQLTDELTEPNRPSAPFTISIDLSDRVNQRIDEIPVVGTFIPDVSVPPIERELIDAETFDSVRQAYGGIKLVATWGLLIGVLLIVGGFFVAPRSRWYWPQAILGVGILILAISVVVRRVIPAQIAGAVPGGESGGTGTFLHDFLSDNATGPIATRLLQMALWALFFALLFGVIARFLPGWKTQFLPAKVAAGEQGASFEAADATVTAAAPVTTAVMDQDVVASPAAVVAQDAIVVETVELPDLPPEPSPDEVKTVVIESPPSAPAVAGAEEIPADEAPAEVAVVAKKAPARKPAAAKAAPVKPAAAKAAPVKPAAAKAAPAKAAPAKATPAKATPAKATPAKKPTPASDAAAPATPAPKAPRTRKPPTPKE